MGSLLKPYNANFVSFVSFYFFFKSINHIDTAKKKTRTFVGAVTSIDIAS